MSRYFFDFDDEHSRPDDEGTEFASLHAAESEARQTLVQVANDRFQHNEAMEQSIELLVRDKKGQVIYRGSVTLKSESLNG